RVPLLHTDAASRRQTKIVSQYSTFEPTSLFLSKCNDESLLLAVVSILPMLAQVMFIENALRQFFGKMIQLTRVQVHHANLFQHDAVHNGFTYIPAPSERGVSLQQHCRNIH